MRIILNYSAFNIKNMEPGIIQHNPHADFIGLFYIQQKKHGLSLNSIKSACGFHMIFWIPHGM